MTVQAVFFDLGGVILRTEYQAPRQHLAERLGMEYEDIERVVFGSPSAAQASTGKIAETEHWANVAKILKQPASEIERIEKEFFGGDVLDREILDTLRALKSDYTVGLISNAWGGLRAYIEREKFDDAFHFLVISAEVGVTKPDAKIYEIALEQAGVSPNEAVFVDDFIENIEACEDLGMRGIHFRNPEQALTELKQILNEK